MILTRKGLKVLEFNARFGDPETQVLLPRLKSDLFPILYHAAAGSLSSLAPPVWLSEAAVCVVMASGGYPGKYEKNKRISGLEKAKEVEQTFVFHAGTALEETVLLLREAGFKLTAWDLSLESAVKSLQPHRASQIRRRSYGRYRLPGTAPGLIVNIILLLKRPGGVSILLNSPRLAFSCRLFV